MVRAELSWSVVLGLVVPIVIATLDIASAVEPVESSSRIDQLVKQLRVAPLTNEGGRACQFLYHYSGRDSQNRKYEYELLIQCNNGKSTGIALSQSGHIVAHLDSADIVVRDQSKLGGCRRADQVSFLFAVQDVRDLLKCPIYVRQSNSDTSHVSCNLGALLSKAGHDCAKISTQGKSRVELRYDDETVVRILVQQRPESIVSPISELSITGPSGDNASIRCIYTSDQFPVSINESTDTTCEIMAPSDLVRRPLGAKVERVSEEILYQLATCADGLQLPGCVMPQASNERRMRVRRNLADLAGGDEPAVALRQVTALWTEFEATVLKEARAIRSGFHTYETQAYDRRKVASTLRLMYGTDVMKQVADTLAQIAVRTECSRVLRHSALAFFGRIGLYDDALIDKIEGALRQESNQSMLDLLYAVKMTLRSATQDEVLEVRAAFRRNPWAVGDPWRLFEPICIDMELNGLEELATSMLLDTRIGEGRRRLYVKDAAGCETGRAVLVNILTNNPSHPIREDILSALPGCVEEWDPSREKIMSIATSIALDLRESLACRAKASLLLASEKIFDPRYTEVYVEWAMEEAEPSATAGLVHMLGIDRSAHLHLRLFKRLLSSENSETRKAAAKTLSMCIATPIDRMQADELRPLLQGIVTDSDIHVAINSAELFAKMRKSSLETRDYEMGLIERLESDDPVVIAGACWCLSEMSEGGVKYTFPIDHRGMPLFDQESLEVVRQKANEVRQSIRARYSEGTSQ